MLDKASYRRGFDKEVKVAESNTDNDSIELLWKCVARSVTEKRGI